MIWIFLAWFGKHTSQSSLFKQSQIRHKKSATNNLLKKKKAAHSKRRNTHTSPPSFSNLFASILFLSPFLSFCFTSHPEYPMAMMITRYPISSSHCSRWAIRGPHQGGKDSLRGWISRVISARWMEFCLKVKREAVLRGGIGRLIAMDFS